MRGRARREDEKENEASEESENTKAMCLGLAFGCLWLAVCARVCARRVCLYSLHVCVRMWMRQRRAAGDEGEKRERVSSYIGACCEWR